VVKAVARTHHKAAGPDQLPTKVLPFWKRTISVVKIVYGRIASVSLALARGVKDSVEMKGVLTEMTDIGSKISVIVEKTRIVVESSRVT
jgi:hypothetical protein